MAVPRPNQHSGPLAGHVRHGRVFKSPLAATGVLKVEDWVRDDLPDLLWPALVLSELGNDEAVRFIRWQEEVLANLDGKADPRFLAECLDGRLTGLDRLITTLPGAEGVIQSSAADRGLLPDSIRRALSIYPDRPAEWLTGLELQPPGEADVKRLARAVFEVMRDGHREALIKCMSIWSGVHTRTFRSDQQTVDLLKYYPNDIASRSEADGAIRSIWGASRGLLIINNPELQAESTKWAKVFWGVNSMTTGCLRKRDVRKQNAEPGEGGNGSEGESEAQSGREDLSPEDFRQRAMDLMSSYVEAVETAPSHLYDPSREEVHTGLVARAAREVIMALGNPDLWSAEHGSHIGRTLVENRILIEWMAQQDQDSIYKEFKDYGAGKAKLYALLASEIPRDWLVKGLDEAISRITAASHNDDVLDHRAVDISGTFAGGKSLRAMAEECGLSDLYRHAYQMQSGVTHSEWWSVEIHCMEPCLNVLHCGHLIPSLSLDAGGNPDVGRSWLIALYGLIRASLSVLGVAQEAVHSAFEWLQGVPAPEDAWKSPANAEHKDATEDSSPRPNLE